VRPLTVFMSESCTLTFRFFHLIGWSTTPGFEIAILLCKRRRTFSVLVRDSKKGKSHWL
jgi:hypothetical protein